MIRPRRRPPGRDHPRHIEICKPQHRQPALRRRTAIAHWRNWKILATGYRGRLTELPNIIRIITTLEHYRLGW